MKTFRLCEATIADIQHAMAVGALSSVELTRLYLNRIRAYDSSGITLNSVPVLNPNALAEASRADQLRAEGTVLSGLHGVPFTVKDSYQAEGLTVAAGSPAFANLISKRDAFVVERIRAAGGVLIGKTNMPPLANGGMQRGLYGRAESPYNLDYLPGAWSSGSSNGAGTSTAANFAAFGIAEETVSSGRSPASNSALVAYTPSRGLISVRGCWPLFPIRDVVVPMTRTMEDMFAVLDVIVVADPLTTGDLWREQAEVRLPPLTGIRPARYIELGRSDALQGTRIGVPTRYVGKDRSADPSIRVRPSILALWQKAARDLRSLGATLVDIDFEPIRRYEVEPGFASPVKRGLLPAEWWPTSDPVTGAWVRSLEFGKLNPFFWERFLRDNDDPHLKSWAQVDSSQVHPYQSGTLDARTGPCRDYSWARRAIAESYQPALSLPGLGEVLRGLERLRKVDFEDWLKANNLDLVVFPANADVGRADSDVNEDARVHATSEGVRCSNTNAMLRNLGIPSVSVTMGVMEDIGMPVNLTFLGGAYADNILLSCAYAYEDFTHNRRLPGRTPPLPNETIAYAGEGASTVTA